MRILIGILLIVFNLGQDAWAKRGDAKIRLVILDGESGKVTPARLEFINTISGKEVIPLGAMSVNMECPSTILPHWFPKKMRGFSYHNYIQNPASGTKQFYLERSTVVEVKPGTYSLKAFKGIEYLSKNKTITVGPGEEVNIVLSLDRWTNSANKGWYSADDHLHITRESEKENPYVLSWMMAEDINVSNLLQMGTQKTFHTNRQYAFGEEGVYRKGDYLLLSGQEHPRTHFLGHTVTLGATEPIDFRKQYILYKKFWERARDLGGVSGYAHWGTGAAKSGLTIDAPSGLISFIEVLQMDFPHYEIWYEILNMGIKMAPVAGTDFPCGPWSIPGRERFYAKVDGKINREKFVKAIKDGKTFVTNGPLITFFLGEKEAGEHLDLDGPKTLRLKGIVEFDHERDKVESVELVQSGVAIKLKAVSTSPGKYIYEQDVEVTETSWFALRVNGEKIGETVMQEQPFKDWQYRVASFVSDGVGIKPRERYAKKHGKRPSAAHTGAVYIHVKGTEGFLEKQKEIAKSYIDHLKYLEYRLSEKNYKKIPLALRFIPNSDSLNLKTVRENRKELLEHIQEAKKFYQDLLKKNHTHSH